MSHGPRRFPRLSPAGTGLPAAGCPDTDLLARFTAARDEAAFELLLRRHGPMVLGVCRRVLADPNDADDAFQATFLVLARKAGAVGCGGTVAGWLHRVARHAALRVRADRARQAARAGSAPDDLPGPAPPDPGWAELGRVLDEEVGRLPTRHRAAFVLCCLEGKTGEEAARVLGCPAGTVSSRLTRARERLRARLTRRGFAPAAVAAALSAAAPALSARLADTSLAAALAFAAGRPPAGPPSRPAATAEGVIRTMFLHKAQLAALLLVGGVLAAGGLLAGAGAQPTPADPPRAKAGDAKAPANPAVVAVVRPTKGGLDRAVTARAVAEAVQRADLFPAVAGRLKAVAVDVGDKVKAGQVLAEIDAPDAALDERQAEAGLLQAEAKLKEAEVRVGIARSELDAGGEAGKQKEAEAADARAVLAHRRKQFARTKELHATGAVDAKLLDDAAEQVRAAEAQVAAADAGVKAAGAEAGVRAARLALAEAGVGTAKADIQAARVAVERARLVLARARVTAPFDGVIARRNAWPGDAARPDAAGRPPLFTLSQVSAVRVALEVPSAHLPQVAVGAPAEVAFDAFPDQPFAGKVGRIAPDVVPATGMVRAEVDVPNPGGKVLPGMTGDARVAFGKGPADALRVPIAALLPVDSRRADRMTHQVYVVRGGAARLTPVRVVYAQGTEAEVAAGLTADDLVVADPRGLQGDDVPVRVGPSAPR